ncbi:MAG: hypothetical protein ACYTFK_03480 [Planctomycetota bacterium]|jgi:hypothetical protein
MPSGAFLYNNTIEFRRFIFETYDVPQIVDFNSLRKRNDLFNKSVSVCVVFLKNIKPNNNPILHMIVRRTKVSKEKLYFEIDKYDLYFIPKEIAKTEQLIWKINLLGGTHLYSLIKKVGSLETIREFLDNRQKLGWVYGTGYIVGNKKEYASHLHGKPMIPTELFVDDYINQGDITREKETNFERPRGKEKKKIFKAPHVLIKTNKEMPICLLPRDMKADALVSQIKEDENDLIFRMDITGIHAPQKSIVELSQFVDDFKACRRLYKALLLIKSGRFGVGRETSIKSGDILDLPGPDAIQSIKLNKAEKIAIDDVIKYGFDQSSKGDEAVVNIKNAGKRDMNSFGKIFCDSLNSIYNQNGKQFYHSDTIESQSYICTTFIYGNPEIPKNISKAQQRRIAEGDLDNLIDNQQGQNVLYKRVVTLYSKNIIYLIKPKTLRYWLKSIALRDASDIFTDLVSSGY